MTTPPPTTAAPNGATPEPKAIHGSCRVCGKLVRYSRGALHVLPGALIVVVCHGACAERLREAVAAAVEGIPRPIAAQKPFLGDSRKPETPSGAQGRLAL